MEKRDADGNVKRFRHRIVETVITTVSKKYSDLMGDGSPVRMEEFEIDDAHPENERLDPAVSFVDYYIRPAYKTSIYS